MEWYLAFKRKEILVPATTWMNLEDIIPSDKAVQKEKFYMISITWALKFTEAESRVGIISRDRRESERQSCYLIHIIEFQFY